MSSTPPPSKRQRVDAAEHDEATNSFLLDFPRLTQEVDLEASEDRSCLNHTGKCVLIGHLTQDHMQRAIFLGMSSSPVMRTHWIKKEMRKHFPVDFQSFFMFTNIIIKVEHESHDTVIFKMSYTNSFRKLFEAWCERKRHDLSESRFFYNDSPLLPEDTPDTFDMEVGDMIEVRTAQGGNFLE